jgi:hypothetical protein
MIMPFPSTRPQSPPTFDPGSSDLDLETLSESPNFWHQLLYMWLRRQAEFAEGQP